MKKKLTKLLVITAFMILIPINVYAITGTYTISSNSSVNINNTISVTFKISASKMFYWQSYITYDTSKLQLVSGSTNFQGESESLSGQSSVSKTLKFKAKKAGSSWVAISMGDKGNNINIDSKEITYSKKTKTITVKEIEKKEENKTTEKTTTKKTYSSNNYLKSLTIDGYKLSPTFNKNKLDYTITLPENTTNIKINATKEDNKASISGTGIIKVTEGINNLKIKVTAENGNIKTYTIKATVKEEKPIEVTINNNKYTIIRKKEQLPKVNSIYEQTTIKYQETNIPVLKSEITNYTLIGLKDSEGNINLYIYDEQNNKFSIYNEITFNTNIISPIEDESIEIPKQYKEKELLINNIKVKAYYYKNEFPIFKGINIETGEKGLYSYDDKEKTVQRYLTQNNSILSTLTNNSLKVQNSNTKLYLYTIISLGILLLITYIIILIKLIKKNKKQIEKELETQKIELEKEKKREIDNKTEVINKNEKKKITKKKKN